ncbi:hypothetical protein P8452_68723 [Trifolium repens]|nr:hypothetical protein P8452_68723 [Trifolium repens]
MGGIGKTTLAAAMFHKVSFQYEESPKNPGQRSRLFDPKEICGVLKNNRGTDNVEAIFFYANECTNIILSPQAFEKMVNLRLLAIHDQKGYVSLPHGLDLLPENLRYVSWHGYPWKSLPPTFCPEMLVELSLKESHVQKLWNGVLNLPNLEILDLSSSKKLIECPNVSGFPNLKEVILGDCESLLEVDSSIFLLQKLTRIFMAGCTSLKSLSSNTCSPALLEFNVIDCINLQEFSVTFSSVDNLFLALPKCGGNELPSSILQTKNLKLFLFPMIEDLVNLPENFAENILLTSPVNRDIDPSIVLHKLLSSPAFVSVTHLNLTNISVLSEIPDNIYLLSSLESLTLIGLAIRSLPETIKYLPRISEFGVYDCKMLQSIPMFSKFISSLVVWNCESIEKVLMSSSTPCLTVLLNCNKLDIHSYQTVLKDAIAGIELRARLSSQQDVTFLSNEYLLPVMPGREYWFQYTSTQVSFTLDLPRNLFGFAYYLVISQGRVENGAYFRCECYLENSATITSFMRVKSMGHHWINLENSIHMMSDHVVLWYDPISCKQIMDAVEAINDVNSTGYNPKLTFRFFIDESETLYDEMTIKELSCKKIMEEIKAINDVNSTSYNPKLTFTFFIDDTLYDEVEIKECGFRWIYQEEEEETIHPRRKLDAT